MIREDDASYRRDGDTLTASGGKSRRAGDVVLPGDDTVHAVANPRSEHAGAIHIYGGDLFATSRNEWRGDPYRDQALRRRLLPERLRAGQPRGSRSPDHTR